MSSSPSCSLIIIDNFYTNPDETRNYILQQPFEVTGNYPGKRTKSFLSQEVKDTIQKYVEPFGGTITQWPLDSYNGSFQYTTSSNRSWIHTDAWNNWAGVLYLTPDAPLTSGTGIYMYKDGSRYECEKTDLNNKSIDRDAKDITKWKLIDRIGNVYNRLILFNSKQFHSSIDYFGHDKESGRLFQLFFFSTER